MITLSIIYFVFLDDASPVSCSAALSISKSTWHLICVFVITWKTRLIAHPNTKCVYETLAISFVKLIRRTSYRRCRKGAVALMQRERLLRVRTYIPEKKRSSLAYISARGRRGHVAWETWCVLQLAYFTVSLSLARKRAHLTSLLPAHVKRYRVVSYCLLLLAVCLFERYTRIAQYAQLFSPAGHDESSRKKKSDRKNACGYGKNSQYNRCGNQDFLRFNVKKSNKMYNIKRKELYKIYRKK